jgi:hypothetical protein
MFAFTARVANCPPSFLRKLIETIPLFKMFHNAFIRKMVMKLHTQISMEGDPIVLEGQNVPGVFFGTCISRAESRPACGRSRLEACT